MKSKIEIRKFAVEMAVAIMGAGTADKDVVSKAKEIEGYIIGDAVLPEYNDDSAMLSCAMGTLASILRPDDNAMQIMELKKK